MQNVIFTTLLIEQSPQALPLGAACCASALKNDSRSKNSFNAILLPFNKEDKKIQDCLLNIKIGEDKNSGEQKAASYMAEQILKHKPNIVCFSVYVWNRIILEFTAQKLKEKNPTLITIAGGPEITANPLNAKNFDWTICGQGENATVELLCAIRDGKDNSFNLNGIYKKSNDKECTNNRDNFLRASVYPSEKLFSPYLDETIDLSKYGGALWELARGCPFKCSYCYESKGEKAISYFPIDRLKKELILFKKKKISQVFVLDPTYNANKQRALQMLDLIQKHAPGIFFYFEARAEYIDRQLAHAFTKIPCALQIGLQSADEKVLKNVNRTFDKKKFIKNINYLNEEGVTFGLDLIFALPGDNYKGFKNTIDFALSLYPNNLELFCLSVLPGTDLHDKAKTFNLEWQNEPPYHVLKTPQFPPEDIKKADNLSKAINLFYTKGRAVPWFNNVLYPTHEKASRFFEDLVQYLTSKQISVANINDDEAILKIQLDFVHKKYIDHKLEKLWPVAQDLIKIHHAIGKCTYDATQSIFEMNYHPDDIMSKYACDLIFFAQNAGKQKTKVKVYLAKTGVDWKTI